MQILDKTVAPLGMGCWPIGGEMYADGASVGYTGADDAEALRAIHAALDHGITLFDTAAAYGTGHAERLLAQGLKGRPEAVVVTKIGIAIDEASKQLNGYETDPARVQPAIDACLRRLERDCIDIVLLHQNESPVAVAAPLFAEMDKARAAGKIRGFGWSTDFTASAAAMAPREGFVAVQHAMNLFIPASRMQALMAETGLVTLLRSPLAMGLLSGKYDAQTRLPAEDVRTASLSSWAAYFQDGRPNPAFLDQMTAVRDLLTTGGRSLVQGALGWLWAKRAENIPIPGARTAAQIEGLAGALAFGPLPPAVMAEIETLIPREAADAPDRQR
ncbi:aldo/keto reductase [uncultured Roseobacter sp.]|uniref:aldo/keto reductase n=1 Tax=uncultured Roseobacter sp. TaxID=114847 RepID=UPI00262A641C|nr:aldo/keto reductase [uncultured Roseobacter sp.]